MPTSPLIVYNVQRLFRPDGSRVARSLGATSGAGWTREAYRRKVDAVGAVLADAVGGARPAVIVFAEVEDHTVVVDVVTAAGWPELVDVIVPDEQVEGYDVAVAYDPNKFTGGVDTATSHLFDNRFSTRDLLEVTLSVGDGRQLTVCATHWPSRILGEAVYLRFAAAVYCTHVAETHLKFPRDELITISGAVQMPARQRLLDRWWTPMLIAGDFNDCPWDPSLRALLRSTPDVATVVRQPRLPVGSDLRSVASYLSLRPQLHNPTWQLLQGDGPPGTYYFDDDWNPLDQLLVSAGMLRGPGPQLVQGSIGVHAPRTVTSRTGQTVEVTTSSRRPIGFDAQTGDGASDHLPLVATLAFD
jgi:Endonuclease/Exonuclease/phosphatase family